MSPEGLIVIYLLISTTCFTLVFVYYTIPYIFILLWPAYVFLFMFLAYAGNIPHLLCKNRNKGTLNWPITILFAPYLVPMWFVWYTRKWDSNEPCYNAIVDGLYLGRFCNDTGKFPADVAFVVDMTAEFSAYQPLVSGRHYTCVPCLDAFAPPRDEELVAVVNEMCQWDTGRGAIYVHCAAGHGRSFLVVVVYLVCKSYFLTVEEAIAYVKSIRPKVALHPAQREAAHRVVSRLTSATYY